MVLVTQDSVRIFQRKLYRKAKKEPKYRFYSLYDKIYQADILNRAYELVRRNKGGPGIDGISFEDIGPVEEVALLRELETELKEKRYKPQAVKRVLIPKGNGEMRPLGIPTIRDRVVQMATKLVLEPIFEADFTDHSYGFRPKRGAHDAVFDIRMNLLIGRCMVWDADLSKYFDTIPHAKLMKLVAERIVDKSVLALLQMWLKASVVMVEKGGRSHVIGGGKKNRLGTPQGGVISPLLANLYLHVLDRIWVRNGLEAKHGARIVRYADDFVVLCSGSLENPKRVIKKVLDRLDLKLNEDKTHEVNAYQQEFQFLGFEFRRIRSIRSGKWYPHIQPSKKSMAKIRAQIKEMTRKELSPIPIEEMIEYINRRVRGWVHYFYVGNSSKRMGQVKNYLEQSVRKHLKRRYKLNTWTKTYEKFPNSRLYGEYKLYRIRTKAAWRSSHA